MRDTILYGDCRKTLGTLKAQISIGIADRPRMCVTSPPYYGLRDYGGEESQIGLEQSPEEYIEQMVEVMSLVRNCLTEDGTLWLNIGIVIIIIDQVNLMLNKHLVIQIKTYLNIHQRGQIS